MIIAQVEEIQNFKVVKKCRGKPIFLIFAQNIDCGYMSNEYPQYMFWIKNKKNRYTLAFTPI